MDIVFGQLKILKVFIHNFCCMQWRMTKTFKECLKFKIYLNLISNLGSEEKVSIANNVNISEIGKSGLSSL